MAAKTGAIDQIVINRDHRPPGGRRMTGLTVGRNFYCYMS